MSKQLTFAFPIMYVPKVQGEDETGQEGEDLEESLEQTPEERVQLLEQNMAEQNREGGLVDNGDYKV